MPRVPAVCLTACLLAAWPATALSAEPPLCEVGASVVELMHLHSTGGGPGIDPTLAGSSLIFLEECPASVIRVFREVAKAGSDPDLRHKWIEAVRSAAQHPSNTVVRGLLAAARDKVARLGDHALNEFLDGIAGTVDSLRVDDRSLDSLYARQALATLQQYSKCDGAGCNSASDNLLFLLGTHAVAVLEAIHADSADATRWLRSLADDSFARISERRESREAARRAVLKELSQAKAPGFERERRACQNTLRKIRFRALD